LINTLLIETKKPDQQFVFHSISSSYLHVILFLNQIKIPVYHDETEDVAHVVMGVQDIRTLDVELD
jgi:hypothetical protein